MNTDRPTAPKVTATMLRDIGLFGGLDDDTLATLARELPTEVIEPGAEAVREGELAREMFVVIGGEVEVVKSQKQGGEVRVAVFGPGDWFGEMAILDVQPRSATVRALAPTMLLRFTSDHVDKLLYRRDVKQYALFMMNIARELSRRLRVVDGLLTQFAAGVAELTSPRMSRR